MFGALGPVSGFWMHGDLGFSGLGVLGVQGVV